MIAAAVLIFSAGLVFYILIGYPLLLRAFPFRRLGRPQTGDYLARVSAILTVYNGARFVRGKLDSLLALDYPADLLEIVVVSDGSTDETEAIVEQYARRNVRLVRVPHGGKAAALNAALAVCSGDILFFTDVRQEIAPGSLRRMVGYFGDPQIGAVSGEMSLLAGDRGEHADMDLYWRYEFWARNRHSEIHSVFNCTGCIYTIRRELVAPIPPDTLVDDGLIPLRAFLAGYRVILDPEAVAYDHPAVSGTEFRRKARTLAGVLQIFARLPRLFYRSGPMTVHFLSHKLGRLALPWAILAFCAATVALPASPAKFVLLAGEIALLATAALDMVVPSASAAKRLTSPARTFVLMNAAAVVAIGVFFVDPRRFWKPTRVAVRDRPESSNAAAAQPR